MHEVSLMEETLAIAIDLAHQRQAKKILNLTMSIGEVSGVVPEALRFAFDVVTADTIAAGSTLKIQTIPIHCQCPDCGHRFTPRDIAIYECPQCESFRGQVLTGQEIELTSLEVA